MARSWEYSAGRRRVMQGLMWVLFLASLGVAGVLSNRKPTLPAITLVSEPRHLGELLVHAPSHWRVMQEVSQGKREMAMTEPTDTGEGRTCLITLQSLETGAMTARGLLQEVSGDSTDSFSDFKFKQLGKGVFSVVNSVDGEMEALRPSASAAIVIKRPHDPSQSLGIVVSFFGSSPPNAADQRWLQRIADGLALDTAATTAPSEMEND